MDLTKICKEAVAAKPSIAKAGSNEKNEALKAVAQALDAERDAIKAANDIDVKRAKENNMKPALLDRLTLTDARIDGMIEGLLQLVKLEDPVGEVLGMTKRPNGLTIGKKRVPLGVVAIIYEARPNVTVDAFGLCFKTGNVCILKGGSDALNSTKAIVTIIKDALTGVAFNPDVISLIGECSHEELKELMRMNDYIDVIIPRGGAGLIKSVVNNSTIPVIETGTGNCHIYVDETADFNMALDIIYNAKTQRIGVCNACESLVVHSAVAKEFIPLLVERLKTKDVEIRGDERACEISDYIVTADEADWGTEYLDYIISLKVVDDIDEAISHINRYNTKHSEAIITESYNNANKFLEEIDAACVYVNASTRFTDGFEFGFGAEIGISTQKLHARGPMGLKELTTYKYIIYGNGQVRK